MVSRPSTLFTLTAFAICKWQNWRTKKEFEHAYSWQVFVMELLGIFCWYSLLAFMYVPSDGIKNVRSGLGISILSTSKGVMTGKRARQEKIGGEVLCEAW